MGFAMAPTYGAYPYVNSTVVPVAQAPMATPMMVVPGYAPSCVPVPVYTAPSQPAGMVGEQGHPQTMRRPKQLSEEVKI